MAEIAKTPSASGVMPDQGIAKIIIASAAGTMIEWYDFYISVV